MSSMKFLMAIFVLSIIWVGLAFTYLGGYFPKWIPSYFEMFLVFIIYLVFPALIGIIVLDRRFQKGK